MNQPDQLQMNFKGMSAVFRSTSQRQRRFSRARWWFEQMRQVVDRAFDWQPAPCGRPEQIWFKDAFGQLRQCRVATNRTGNDDRARDAMADSVRAICP